MGSLLYKVESGQSKQTIKPKTWTLVKYPTKTSFKVDANGEYSWTTILRIEYPATGMPDIVRGRFVRYPGTTNADETGHDDKAVMPGWSAESYHMHWTHDILSEKTMPIGFWIWHNGSKSIVLDGRQIKAKPLG